jgi:hypothetical protein
MSGLYVFGIAPAEALPDATVLGMGLAGQPVRGAEAAGLVAIIGAAPPAPVEPTRRNMLAHTALLERAMAEAPILPMRFGTIAPDDATLVRCLTTNQATFRTALSGIEGRVELGVKASWKEGLVFREIVEQDATLRRLRDRLKTRPQSETYNDRIELGRRVEAALAVRRREEAAAILQALSPLAEAEAGLKEIEDTMIVNRAFLVPRAREAAFDAAMEQLGATHGARMEFRYVGPVPPYNFVTLRTDWLSA